MDRYLDRVLDVCTQVCVLCVMLQGIAQLLTMSTLEIVLECAAGAAILGLGFLVSTRTEVGRRWLEQED